MKKHTRLAGLVALLALSGACTRESTRVAFEAQRRADEIQRSVFDRQHAALRVLLYRDTAARLDAAAMRTELDVGSREVLVGAQRAVLNDAWNDRDLFEFWATQQERAAALRIAAVDAKLAADQSIVDLMWKQWSARQGRLVEGLAAARGAALGPSPTDAAETTETNAAPDDDAAGPRSGVGS